MPDRPPTNRPNTEPDTKTSLEQARPSNRKPGVHQRSEAKRNSPRSSQGQPRMETPASSRPRKTSASASTSESASKLTSTGSRPAESSEHVTPAEERTRDQLYLRAAELGINGRSRMTKSELVEAIRAAGNNSASTGGRQ